MFGNHGYTLDPTFLPAHCVSTEEEMYAWHDGKHKNGAIGYRTYINTRHLGGANLCFADGPDEAMRPKQIYQDNRYWNGLSGEDAARDPHLPNKYDAHAEWRFSDIPH